MSFGIISCIFLVAGTFVLACSNCQYLTHKKYILSQTSTRIKGYASTSGIYMHHTSAYIGSVTSHANSYANAGTGGLHVSKTATIENYGSILGSHYETGTRASCYCVGIIP